MDLAELKKTLEEQHKVAVINVHRIEGAIAIVNEQIAEQEKKENDGGSERPRIVAV